MRVVLIVGIVWRLYCKRAAIHHRFFSRYHAERNRVKMSIIAFVTLDPAVWRCREAFIATTHPAEVTKHQHQVAGQWHDRDWREQKGAKLPVLKGDRVT
jgi:hypothetical protein